MSTKWDLSTLQNYINNQEEENHHLEYKSAGALDGNKKDEITKDVTAFANADGGILIYGIKEYEEKSKKHLPEAITPIERTKYPKEWLEQIINNITPRIDGFIIHPIDLPPDHVAYVVEIPRGSTAHQATDHKYYKRYNFQVLSMPDNEV